jgi:hypothetical protein
MVIMFDKKPRMTYEQYMDFLALVKVEGHRVIVKSGPSEFLGKIE